MKKKANQVIREISEKWQALSAEERKSITEEALAELRDSCEMHEFSAHNIEISSFHDIRSTLETLNEEVRPNVMIDFTHLSFF